MRDLTLPVRQRGAIYGIIVAMHEFISFVSKQFISEQVLVVLYPGIYYFQPLRKSRAEMPYDCERRPTKPHCHAAVELGLVNISLTSSIVLTRKNKSAALSCHTPIECTMYTIRPKRTQLRCHIAIRGIRAKQSCGQSRWTLRMYEYFFFCPSHPLSLTQSVRADRTITGAHSK